MNETLSDGVFHYVTSWQLESVDFDHSLDSGLLIYVIAFTFLCGKDEEELFEVELLLTEFELMKKYFDSGKGWIEYFLIEDGEDENYEFTFYYGMDD